MNDDKNYNESVSEYSSLANERPGDTKMRKRLKEKVTLNGKVYWIDGYSIQGLMENYVNLLEREGLIERIDHSDDMPFFENYILDYYSTYKLSQSDNTTVNRNRLINNHILPRFGKKKLNDITTANIQNWYNDLSKEYSHETILKLKNIVSPVFDAAVEDDILKRNPMKSRRIEIHGSEVVPHKAIPREKMEQIKSGLKFLPMKERYMAALLAYTGMRFEEVLGVKWDDITDDGWLIIVRAVVHPTRNQPIVKTTKTKTSERIIPVSKELADILKSPSKAGYILYSDKDPDHDTPLSYSEARRIFNKIRTTFGIEDYSAHDFRDTCATEWRENGMDLDMIARLLGHAKTETTEKKYVKYRYSIIDDARAMM